MYHIYIDDILNYIQTKKIKLNYYRNKLNYVKDVNQLLLY